MTDNPMAHYFAALDRLKLRRAKINNDAVAVEAGRTKGCIKKSRPVFVELIAAIDAAASEQAHPRTEQVARLDRAKGTVSELRSQLDASYARELSLLAEIYELRKQLANLAGEKVLPIRGADRKARSTEV